MTWLILLGVVAVALLALLYRVYIDMICWKQVIDRFFEENE